MTPTSASPVIRLGAGTLTSDELHEVVNARAAQLSRFTSLPVRVAVRSLYDAALARDLLSEGEVATWEAASRLRERYGFFDPQLFARSCAWLEDLVETGGGSGFTYGDRFLRPGAGVRYLPQVASPAACQEPAAAA